MLTEGPEIDGFCKEKKRAEKKEEKNYPHITMHQAFSSKRL